MKPLLVLMSVVAGVVTFACAFSAAASMPTAPVEVQLEAWAGSTRVFLCDFTQGSNCGTHTIPRGATQNLRYEIGGTDHNITCTSSPWNFSWWPNGSYNYTAEGSPQTWTVDCSGDVGGATKTVQLVPWDPAPPPPPPLTDIYGDNSEPHTGWTNAGVTVNQYANRYVVTTSRGIYVIGRSVDGTVPPCCSYPEHYMGPGYIGQFSPSGEQPKMVVNDPLAEGTLGPRDGVHGGLGCFSMDLYRYFPKASPKTVDLNCRLLSSRGPAGQRNPGVYAVDDPPVTFNSDGITVSMTTHYQDSDGPVFSVTYTQRFTPANVLMTTTWRSETTSTDVYIKEPRVVSVLGTFDVPIYSGQGQYRDPPPNCYPPRNDGTYGTGDGVWGLEPDLLRKDYKPGHFWGMDDAVPQCSTVTIGPGATSADRQYHRGGLSFDVVGAQQRDLTVEDPGYYHDYDSTSQPTKNFNVWRREADPRDVIPGYDHVCPSNSNPTDPCRMPIGDTSRANAWELGRVASQYGVFVAIEAWRASITLGDYWGRARRIPAQGSAPYSEALKF